jgi:hypothetical protein
MLKTFSVPTVEGIDSKPKKFDHLALFAFDGCLQVSRAEEALKCFVESLGKVLALALDDAEKAIVSRKTELSEAEQLPLCM